MDNLVDDDEDRIMPTPCEKVLKNVRIYVSRKLVKQQTELYEQAILLGAEFLWNYDESSTHFIYSGKLTDTNKELKIAKEQKKHIVSPNWLLACKEQRQHVDESLYALSMTSSAKSLIQKRSSLTRSSTLTPKAMTPAKSDVLPKEKSPVKEDSFMEDTVKLDRNNQEQSPNQTTNTEVFMSETDVSTVKTPTIEIPDSMDIKLMFIDQLQDKLATIKNNSMHTTKTKWSKNVSGNLQTNVIDSNDLESTIDKSGDHLKTADRINCNDSESQLLANYNFMGGMGGNKLHSNQDETVLSEEQAMNELNHSRSKWGINSGGCSDKNMDKRKKSKSFDKADSSNADMCMENTHLDFDMDGDKKLLKRKAGDKHSDSNQIDESPSLISNKIKKFTNNMEPPASSQIQVTIWKDEPTTSIVSSRGSSSSRASAASKKYANTKNLPDKNDAIADRIIHASRASSASAKK